MDPVTYEQKATHVEQEPSESERAIAEGLTFGRYDETGGETGNEEAQLA